MAKTRLAKAELQATAKRLHDASIAWYAEACAAFPANTPEGAMVRGIPVMRRTATAPEVTGETATPGSG
ncbi:MAG: hypothetical protein COZ06_31660 [Armatimonadetes bacterium CG_4_10_14_3_um_filter_66_18]|nr:MAG: hypothetical protein COZ57_11345 [Armatimonadetes bacterium CG_4_8_14_3_um_filter_66_20]PIY38114.1 MAG: hypothetical protein COZ06_31660 [Armatimonadetes bacterium CG_4_10_14_3_um_filter_66_18]PIZ37972.1 MAG: hypothetical protein COY42_23585 [Armatimonadetes bacterium CG_4_10_14_0_8_um_filter_66_14]PJB63555.1 MAG: hypothetical protein CO096_21850 [Armatimonadetes bacterium CG_4_9_14_3_um_filter_66_14]